MNRIDLADYTAEDLIPCPSCEGPLPRGSVECPTCGDEVYFFNSSK